MLDNGEPWVFNGKTLKGSLTCCDCGLNHLILLDHKGKNKVEMRFFRNDHETRKIREKLPNEDIDYILKYLKGVKRERKKRNIQETKKADKREA